MTALEERASRTTTMFDIPCTFTCTETAAIKNDKAVSHLFRIAQEAVTNAAKQAEELASQAEQLQDTISFFRTGNEERSKWDRKTAKQTHSTKPGGTAERVTTEKPKTPQVITHEAAGTEKHAGIVLDMGVGGTDGADEEFEKY